MIKECIDCFWSAFDMDSVFCAHKKSFEQTSFGRSLNAMRRPGEACGPKGELWEPKIKATIEPKPKEEIMNAPEPTREEFVRSLNLALSHINHMAKWISEQNKKVPQIYSFESLGEDIEEIKSVFTKSVPSTANGEQRLTLDTDKAVYFYEQDFYVFSNFSSFQLYWSDRHFPTSEHAYQWEKFNHDKTSIQYDITRHVRDRILKAKSAHEAFKIAQDNAPARRADWDAIKTNIMHSILVSKCNQHPYVLKKLLASGDRMIIENSWRDDYWGWGPKRDGKNMLGKLWMAVRDQVRNTQSGKPNVQAP